MSKQMGIISASLALMVLVGCQTLPTGPSVLVFPKAGKPFDQFQMEEGACRRWASQGIGTSTQEGSDRNTAQGAVTGTAIGAGIGALLGAASGNAGAGAAIGAGSGLLVGTVAGADAGQSYGQEAQRRYDNTYLQCMYSYGNQIPGRVNIRRTRGYYAPPPPPTAYQDDSSLYPPPDEPPPRLR